jgi:hypothetical protein
LREEGGFRKRVREGYARVAANQTCTCATHNSYSSQVPGDLGSRLQALFRLSSKPRALDQLGELLKERNMKCLEEPRLKAHFQAILKGESIFGHVDYKTPHTTTLLDGRQFYVACALDALVEGFFLPIIIDSACYHCGKPIRIGMSQGNVKSAKPSSAVMWLGASRESVGSCCNNICPYINFFSSTKHAAEWKLKNPDEIGMTLTLQQSLELARKGYWEPIHLL